ncbi:hypothetical protein QPK32_00135 [Massilia sp. YIM B02763]|uniref:esterase/lipase family protein n=1 Tax=Massilia sp. YIM B02763 TaxID=3050130 RepID=UPI0025B695DB|nr:hypothetical protein [Massilia sp. YIM B02763]MDN4051491.1 hypothetical protein [Massilia sp. YIM B02763]
MARAEYPLPAQQNPDAARKATGFVTPKEDQKPQCARMLPKRVLPVIFLPGIMGSNLRMSEQRRKELNKEDNIAWRPDSLSASNIKRSAGSSPRERQLQLDPLQTVVDMYDPSGFPQISGDIRHNNVKLAESFRSPTLADDPPTAKCARSAVQKARARGWGEVYFKSYGRLLQHMESRLNNTFSQGMLRQEWRDVVGVDPKLWQSEQSLPQKPLLEDELKSVVDGCWFPVFAFGYNWLQSNGDSAKIIAERINKVIEEFSQSGYECNQVIVVTHSMGGLVGRALIHPAYGNLQDRVLGIVHGVMPAIGAPAAYKRMRAGFEDRGILLDGEASLGAKVAGNFGDEVTAVLANAQGGLQLLPTEAYGNGWLRVMHSGRVLEAWPKHGDPYSEIYAVVGKWYSLFREEWINPSGEPARNGGGTLARTLNYLERVKHFHRMIVDTYHSNSYGHYGADSRRQSYTEVTWEINNSCADPTGWMEWPILSDTRRGTVELVRWDALKTARAFQPYADEMPSPICATILPPAGLGDQTVPAKSADHQLKSGKFRGIFRQTGYEHQSSYQHSNAIAATLYSIVRIAQHGRWKC